MLLAGLRTQCAHHQLWVEDDNRQRGRVPNSGRSPVVLYTRRVMGSIPTRSNRPNVGTSVGVDRRVCGSFSSVCGRFGARAAVHGMDAVS